MCLILSCVKVRGNKIPAGKGLIVKGSLTGINPFQQQPLESILNDYINLFNESFERVMHSPIRETDFIDIFYQNFFNNSEKVRSKFKNTNMDQQKKILRYSLMDMVDFYTYRNETDYLKKIATLHSQAKHNISPALYELWLEAMMGSLRTCDPLFNEDVEMAWRVVLAPGIAYMKFKYAR